MGQQWRMNILKLSGNSKFTQYKSMKSIQLARKISTRFLSNYSMRPAINQAKNTNWKCGLGQIKNTYVEIMY